MAHADPRPEPGYVAPKKVLLGPPQFLDPGEPVVILTVLYESEEFDVGYVNAMAKMLKKHLTRPYEYWAVSNVPEKVAAIDGVHKSIPMLSELPSKYCKMEMWRPDIAAMAKGRMILATDLDHVFVSNMDKLTSYKGEHCMMRSFAPHIHSENRGAGGLQIYRAGFGTQFYEMFASNPEFYMQHYPLGHCRGDMLFIQRHSPVVHHTLQDILPDVKIYSYLKHSVFGRVPKDAVMIAFHGKNNPRNCMDKHAWIGEHWCP